MTVIELKTHPGIGAGIVEGPALVAKDNFSARYDLDLRKGIFSRPEHKLAGQSYDGRVLVLDLAKGGVATAWMLYAIKESGKAPKALLLNRANPIMAQGAAFGGIALLDRFDVDITQIIRTSDRVRVDPMQGVVTILRDD
jgi:hypothetical protein